MHRSKGKKNKKSSFDQAVGVPFGIKHVPKHPKFIRGTDSKFDDKLFMTIWKNPDNTKYQQAFPKFIFEPSTWSQYHTKHKGQATRIKGMRILIQISTIHAILSGKYFVYADGDIESEKVEEQEDEENDTNEQQAKEKEELKESSASKSKSKSESGAITKSIKCIELPKHSIADSVSKTIMHPEEELFHQHFFDELQNNNDDGNGPKMMVINDDMLSVSKYIMQKYRVKPLVLCMASRGYPGGGYRTGAGAQEEDLCRRSTYFCNVDDPYNFNKRNRKWTYPLPEFGGIYSPNVLVFRDGLDRGYAFYDDHPKKMSFVSVYCYGSPNLDKHNRMSKNLEKRTLKKIEAILRIAILHKHRCLVLSAFGSGAYENPPEHMAELFQRALSKEEYKQFFSMIIFAIINDKNCGKQHNPKGNVAPYSQIFNVPILSLSDSP